MKVGDKVKRLPEHHRTFFYDANAIYTITQVSNLGRTIKIVDSDGKYKDSWDADKFEVVDDEPDYLVQFKEAIKYIGKTVKIKDGTLSYTITDVVLLSKNTTSECSYRTREYLKTHEFCVVCKAGYSEFPYEDVKPLPESMELKISNEYTAQVYKDKVVVGCQTIPIDTVKEIIKLSESL